MTLEEFEKKVQHLESQSRDLEKQVRALELQSKDLEKRVQELHGAESIRQMHTEYIYN